MRAGRRSATPRRPLCGAGAALLAVWLAGCAVPLGPGFGIEHQQVEFDYAEGDVARVRSVYRLRNTGNEPLERLPVNLPHGLASFRATVDGRPADVQLVESIVEDAPAAGRRAAATFTFSPPAARNRRFHLALEYTVPVRAHLPLAAAGGDAFYLSAEDWFPELVRPAAMFARGAARHDDVRMTVRVPDDWRVLTSGRGAGRRGRGEAAEHRFRLRGDDAPPYLLAGRYHEYAVSAHGQTIIFWAFAPLDPPAAQAAGARLAADLAALEAMLGPRARRTGAPTWVVELDDTRAVDSSAFAAGLILLPQQMAELVSGQLPSPRHRATLAGIWFERVTQPEDRLAVQLAEGLKHFSMLGLEQLAGGNLRSAHIAARIAEFDRLAAESPPEMAALEKMRVFLLALEDVVGQKKLHAGLRRMVQARRGDTWNRSDLRAALELESGQDLAEIFRRWLDEPGIPEDFRARYAGAKDRP